QPVDYRTLRRWVTSVGLHVGRARVSALRQLVLDVPAPVTATALGFAHFTTHRHVVAAGGTWNRYAPRTRRPARRQIPAAPMFHLPGSDRPRDVTVPPGSPPVQALRSVTADGGWFWVDVQAVSWSSACWAGESGAAV